MFTQQEIRDENELNFLLKRLSEYELKPEDTTDLEEFLNNIKIKYNLVFP